VKKLLIIDDNSAFSTLMDALFGEEFEIHRARDGLMGIDKALEVRPDLIFLDVLLPRLSGIEVLRQLQAAQETSSTPVIVITAEHLDARMERTLQKESNVNSFLTKSCGANTLLAQVYQILGEPDSAQSESTQS
jgi:DNA-binding response OmpR family regulator